MPKENATVEVEEQNVEEQEIDWNAFSLDATQEAEEQTAEETEEEESQEEGEEAADEAQEEATEEEEEQEETSEEPEEEEDSEEKEGDKPAEDPLKEDLEEDEEDIFDIKEDEPDGSWTDLGKELGFEVGEDSLDAFKEAQESHIQSLLEADRADRNIQMVESMDDIFQGVTDEQKAQVALAINQVDISDELKYIEDATRIINMSDEELVKAKLLNTKNPANGQPKYTEERADELVERYKEHDELEDRAWDIKSDFGGKIEAMKDKIAEKQNTAIKEVQTKIAEVRQSNIDNFNKAVDSLDNLYGKNLTTKAKDKLKELFTQGKAPSLSTNPQAFAKMMAQFVYGETVVKNIVPEEFQKGKKKVYDKLSNKPAPSTKGAVAKRKSQEQDDPDAPDFSKWAIG